jgi:hypothetical protein
VLVREAVSGVYERGLAEFNGIEIETPTAEEWAARVESADGSNA